MNTDNVVETIETNHDIIVGEAYLRLKDNPDFKTVISEGYLEGKVLASVSMLAVPQEKAAGNRPHIMEDLIAASNLKYFFMMIINKYEGAVAPVLSDEEQVEMDAMAEAEAAANLGEVQ